MSYYAYNSYYNCETCDRSFSNEHALDQHMDALGHWQYADYECETCEANFRSQEDCTRHMKKLNHFDLSQYPYDCETPGCKFKFRTWEVARSHMDKKDHWAYNYKCDTCNLCFRAQTGADNHMAAEGHWRLYCKACDRHFLNENCLRQHLNSRTHRGAQVPCPFACGKSFATASGVSNHLETSSCPKASNLDRQKIHTIVRARDTAGTITERLLEWKESPTLSKKWDPASAWNGRCYECYVCHRGFVSAQALRQHVTSPVHQQQSLYHCPKNTCAKKFPSLAGLFNHWESESCGYTRFETVQKQVKKFFSEPATAKNPPKLKTPTAHVGYLRAITY